jgi:hypothetical protein
MAAASRTAVGQRVYNARRLSFPCSQPDDARTYIAAHFGQHLIDQPKENPMVTAAILAPHYFVFGSRPDSELPAKFAIADIDSPRTLFNLCDSAYRLFYCCLPLYDRVKLPTIFHILLSGVDQAGEAVTAVNPGLKLLKHLVDTGVAEFDPVLDDDKLGASDRDPGAGWQGLGKDFLTPELVEAILKFLPHLEGYSVSEETLNVLLFQPPEIVKVIAGRISESLRDKKPLKLPEIGEEESELLLESGALRGIQEAMEGLLDLGDYAARTGQDVYALKYYVPLLLYMAVNDKLNYTGLRSFSLVLPIIDSADTYSQARASFTGLRKAIDSYQRALAVGEEAGIAAGYAEVDKARHESLKQEFDGEGKRTLITVTCLMAAIRGMPLRYFLPDDHFQLSLAMQHRRYLSAEQTSAFDLLLDAVLLGIKDLGVDGSIRRALLASCTMQPLLDFTVFGQCQRLNLEEQKKEMIGNAWKRIKKEIVKLGEVVGEPLEHLGGCVLTRRNILAHPADNATSVARTRGEALSDLCRLVDFIRILDCSIPPTV